MSAYQKPQNQSSAANLNNINIGDVVNMTYSTLSLKKKVEVEFDEKDLRKRLIEMIKSVIKTHANNQVKNKIIIEDHAKTELEESTIRDDLVFESYGSYKFTLHKKGKRMGFELFREADIKDVKSIEQTKKGKLKYYNMPTVIVPELKAEYEKAMSRSHGNTKTTILPWTKPDVRTKLFRVLINNPPKDILNRAFYFDDEKNFRKVRDYLKCNQLLEQIHDASLNPILRLKKIQAYFQGQLTLKLKQQIRKYAHKKENQIRLRREKAIKSSNSIMYYNQKLWKELSMRWFKLATDLNFAGREKKNREQKLRDLLARSDTIRSFDKRLVNQITKMWRDEAERRREPDREDISIVFQTIEIPKNVVKPSIKIEIKVADSFPQVELPLYVSGVPANRGSAAEIYLGGTIKSTKGNDSITWKLHRRNIEVDTGAIIRIQNTDKDQKFNLSFDYFRMAQLDAIEIKVTLLDENDLIQGYQYMSLRNIYKNSKKGQDLWLALSAKPDNQDDLNRIKFPLLHLKVRTRFSDKHRSLVAPIFEKDPKFYKENYINDIFYYKVLEFPKHINPKTYKFIELLNEKWSFLHSELRFTQNQNDLGEFIQRVKYKLVRYYHKNASRRMAKLKKSYYLWAILQDKITSHFSNSQLDQSQVLADESFVANLDDFKKPNLGEPSQSIESMDPNKPKQNSNKIVSYLFKRDKWENKADWKKFFDDLYTLCKKGIPPGERHHIWSELGRVVYFIGLTEKVFNNIQGIHDFDNKNLGNRQKKLTDDEEFSDNYRILNSSLKVYEKIKKASELQQFYVYQQLEDDIEYLRNTENKEKLVFESNIRSICKALIYWGYLFSKSNDQYNYCINYSKSILIITKNMLLSQSCTYLEDNLEIEEDTCFWLLISLTTFILPGYFETNSGGVSVDSVIIKDKQRKKHKIVNSALKNQRISGIKSDLLLLKLMLQERQPEIWSHIQQFGVPLDFYFADHMLTIFSDLFNPGLVFRIWDMIFLEGSGSNQVKSQRFIVCILYTLLVECKDLILKTKKASDVLFIIELYAKFQIKYGQFLNTAISYSIKYFEVSIPTGNASGIFEKINIIKFALFSTDTNHFDNKILECEKNIMPAMQSIAKRNKNIFNLITKLCNYKGQNEMLTYANLANIVYQFIEDYGNGISDQQNKKKPTNFPEDAQILDEFNDHDRSHFIIQNNILTNQTPNSNNKKFIKPKFQRIQILIHNLVLFSTDMKSLSLRLIYGTDIKEFTKFTSFNVNFFTEFKIKNEYPRYIKIEIYDENSLNQLIKVKTGQIDLKGFTTDKLSKNIIRLNEELDNLAIENYLTSELEFSILLISGQSKPVTGMNFNPGADPLKITELEMNENYGLISQVLKLNYSYVKFFNQMGDMFDYNALRQTIVNSSKTAWKENFNLSFEEFQGIIKQIVPAWLANGVNLLELYTSFAETNPNNNFYIIDFFIVLIFSCKFSLNKKFEIIFDFLAEFDDIFMEDNNEITLKSFKELIRYLYEIFMVPMTCAEVDNMIDFIAFGQPSCIVKATINDDSEAKIEIPTIPLNQLAIFVQNRYYGKNLILNDEEFMKFVRECFIKELDKVSYNQAKKLLPKNKLDISYILNGMRHKIRIDFDINWQIIIDKNEKNAMNAKLLHLYKSVITFSNLNKCLKKHEYMAYIQKIPLLNYLASLENTEITPSLNDLQQVRFEIQMNKEPVFEINPSFDVSLEDKDTSLEQKSQNKKIRFRNIYLNWGSLIQSKQVNAFPRSKSVSLSMLNKPIRTISLNLQPPKVNFYALYPNFVKQIKRQIMKKVAKILSGEHQGVDSLNPMILDPDFWLLDYQIAIRLNRQYEFNISETLKTSSGFTSLQEIWRQTQFNESGINTLEIIVNLENKHVNDVISIPYDQLALYRFADHSADWYSCNIISKYQILFDDEDENQVAQHIDGYGVIFEKYPDEIAYKKLAEVCVIKDVDLNELKREIKRKLRYQESGLYYSGKTSRAKENVSEMKKSSNQDQRRRVNPQAQIFSEKQPSLQSLDPDEDQKIPRMTDKDIKFTESSYVGRSSQKPKFNEQSGSKFVERYSARSNF